MQKTAAPWFSSILSLGFVSLYGSGFVGAKYGVLYASPLAFLMIRFAMTACLLGLFALCVKVPWPRHAREVMHIAIAGVLMIGVFSAGVLLALDFGVSPSESALIIALQPILVALGARLLLCERVRAVQWLGLLLGLLGVFLLISKKLVLTHTHFLGLCMGFMALLGLSAGNIYQKRFCADMPIVSGNIIQCLAACSLTALAAFSFETIRLNWSLPLFFALSWMAIVVSIGALSLLYILIREGEVSQVASLFYFVPVSTAILSYLCYGETIGYVGVLGMMVTALGIRLVRMTT